MPPMISIMPNQAVTAAYSPRTVGPTVRAKNDPAKTRGSYYGEIEPRCTCNGLTTGPTQSPDQNRHFAWRGMCSTHRTEAQSVAVTLRIVSITSSSSRLFRAGRMYDPRTVSERPWLRANDRLDTIAYRPPQGWGAEDSCHFHQATLYGAHRDSKAPCPSSSDRNAI